MDTRRATAREFSSRVADELGVSMELAKAGGWGPDWAWGIPLTVLTSVIHVFGLGLINEKVVPALGERMDRRRSTFLAATMSVAVLFATLLHTFEATLWAAAYLWLSLVA
jgi:MFS superfamily sulfate permease-like transporter